MVTSNTEVPKKTLQIKQDDKFFTNLVTKENSLANPSFRVYYGGVSGSIPFTWEIQPGTPKHKFSDNSLPPLTPPPSYYTNSQKPNKKNSRSKLFNTLLLKIHLKKPQTMMTSSFSYPSSPSFSSSWSSYPSSTASNVSRSRRRFLSFGSLFDDGMDNGHVYGRSSSPTSVHCFGSVRTRYGGNYRDGVVTK